MGLLNNFSGRKGAEAVSVAILCQRPLLSANISEGCVPIYLGHVTSFGLWLLEQVVLEYHQRKSASPMFKDVFYT